jgi:hypothetical protein
MVTNNTGIDFDADLATITADLPDTFTHAGTVGSIVCVISTVNKGTVIDGLEGPANEISMEIVVRTSLLTVRPVSDEPVTVGGVQYRILRVETDEPDAALSMIIGAFTA